MAATDNIVPGMVLSIGRKLYQVEEAVKVEAPKGAPFIKAKLRDLATKKLSEKNFKLNQTVDTVSPVNHQLEYLYVEGKDYLFMDIDSLEQILVPEKIVGPGINYLKEGTQISASLYGDVVINVELPQFVELMVVRTEGEGEEDSPLPNASRVAHLESGAAIEVPPFIEMGDIIKVDTNTDEYIQRV